MEQWHPEPTSGTTATYGSRPIHLVGSGNEDDAGVRTAMRFKIGSPLHVSALGRHILKWDVGGTKESHRASNDYWDLLTSHGLVATAQVGVAMRARLKARGTDDAEKLANLQKLWTNGDEDGFGDYVKTDHFFGGWSTQRRAQLFAVGIDQMYTIHGESVPEVTNTGGITPGGQAGYSLLTAGQDSGFHTRSFPILEKSKEHPGWYGDVVDLFKSGSVGGDNLHFNSPELMQHQRQNTWLHLWDDEGFRATSDEFVVSLAKGFFEGDGSSHSDLFPETLTLDGSTNVVFDVEYQWITTYRAALTYTNTMGGEGQKGQFRISDTGLIYVWPSNNRTDLDMKLNLNKNDGLDLADGEQGKSNSFYGGHASQGPGVGIPIQRGSWLTEDHGIRSEKDMHFDDNQNESNKRSIVYAPAPKPENESFDDENLRLGGISISEQGVRINNQDTA